MGELVGGGSVAVAVGGRDRSQVTGDRWHRLQGTIHNTQDTRHMKCDM